MQKKYVIGKHVIGGEPGENPTWLVGSLFYMGDKALLDEKGVIDKGLVEKRINEALSIADEYGLVFAVDLVFPSVESVEPILDYMAGFDDLVLFLDSPDPEARARSYLLAREKGLLDRVVGNGLYTDSPGGELEAIKESGLQYIVAMAFDPRNPAGSISPESRIRLLEEVLIPKAMEVGVENILVDAIVIDPASIALSAETIRLVKEKHGYPSGCAPANALGPVSKKRVGVESMISIHGGAAVFLRAIGADFIMYGPVSRIKYVAEAVALTDSLLAYSLKQRGVKIPRSHPLYKYLRKIQKLFVAG